MLSSESTLLPVEVCPIPKKIEPTINRYYFIRDPRKLIVKGFKRALTVRVPLHSDHPERGMRQVKVRPEKGNILLWISSDDMNLVKKGSIIRFIGLFNVQIKSVETGIVEAVYHSESHEEAKKLGVPLIHWIPANTGIPCEVTMPDTTVIRGIAEDACREVKPNEMIHFERFGFVTISNMDWKLTAHNAPKQKGQQH